MDLKKWIQINGQILCWCRKISFFCLKHQQHRSWPAQWTEVNRSLPVGPGSLVTLVRKLWTLVYRSRSTGQDLWIQIDWAGSRGLKSTGPDQGNLPMGPGSTGPDWWTHFHGFLIVWSIGVPRTEASYTDLRPRNGFLRFLGAQFLHGVVIFLLLLCHKNVFSS